ncbi:MAG: ferritin [Candidatus Eisenbacteria bacterium]|nr:ferritin [Candidatus Eisenbacteria bacterium]
MIPEKIQAAFNEQIREEMESAYIYLSMAAYFESQGLEGMATWMRSQTAEEVAHAMRFFDHISERGGRVSLQGLKQPQAEWNSPLEAFQAAYKHEQYITQKIHELVDLATAERDHPAHAMLQWFVTEQVEEEASTSKIVEQLERIGDSGNGLLMLDRELGRRPIGSGFAPPAPEA